MVLTVIRYSPTFHMEQHKPSFHMKRIILNKKYHVKHNLMANKGITVDKSGDRWIKDKLSQRIWPKI